MIFGRLDLEACAVVNLPTDSVWRYFLASASKILLWRNFYLKTARAKFKMREQNLKFGVDLSVRELGGVSGRVVAALSVTAAAAWR